MKAYTLFLVVNLIVTMAFGQKTDYNLEDGYTAEGYDVVAYFDDKALEGQNSFLFSYDGAKYKFSSQANLDKFTDNPAMYIPQYGGWCAYAVGAKNEKISTDPNTFEIRDGKLYLFYNAFSTNTFNSWIEEGPEQLIKKGNANWIKLKNKN